MAPQLDGIGGIRCLIPRREGHGCRAFLAVEYGMSFRKQLDALPLWASLGTEGYSDALVP